MRLNKKITLILSKACIYSLSFFLIAFVFVINKSNAWILKNESVEVTTPEIKSFNQGYGSSSLSFMSDDEFDKDMLEKIIDWNKQLETTMVPGDVLNYTFIMRISRYDLEEDKPNKFSILLQANTKTLPGFDDADLEGFLSNCVIEEDSLMLSVIEKIADDDFESYEIIDIDSSNLVYKEAAVQPQVGDLVAQKYYFEKNVDGTPSYQLCSANNGCDANGLAISGVTYYVKSGSGMFYQHYCEDNVTIDFADIKNEGVSSISEKIVDGYFSLDISFPSLNEMKNIDPEKETCWFLMIFPIWYQDTMEDQSDEKGCQLRLISSTMTKIIDEE